MPIITHGTGDTLARRSRRSLLIYAGFVAMALACRAALELITVDYPHPSQRELMQWQGLLLIFGLGLIGAWLAPRGGLGAGPANAPEWRRLLVWAIGLGLIFGAIAVGLDDALGFSRMFAATLGIAKLHLAFPASAFAYTVGATVVECLYRIIPLPLALSVWALLARGRGKVPAFWLVALATSLLEPLGQVGVLRELPLLFALLGGFIFVVNLIETLLFRRFGLAAPMLVRLAFYLVWHVAVGPFVTGV